MATLKPDRTYEINGVTVNEFLITRHNDHNVAVGYNMKGNRIGVTVHNTARLDSVAETQAEQYSRATYNDNMSGVIVHFYVDEVGAWQLLPLDISGFHAADGNGPGNRRTIAVECIMDGSGSEADRKSEENCAKLVAGLLKMFDFEIGDMYTHNHWYPPKYCPAFILPRWTNFIAKVEKYLSTQPEQASAESKKENMLYRVRLSWNEPATQVGAYADLENAKSACKDGYSVYDPVGKVIYTKATQEKTVAINIRKLSEGSSGDNVKAMQSLLNASGHNCGAVDGKFGPATAAALEKFQKSRNIAADKICGAATWTELLK